MYCLSFDLNFLITSLVSSNSSYPSRASELNPSFCGVHGAWSLVFCVVFCRSLFLFFFFSIVLSVLWFTDSDYPFGIFKLFLPLQSIWAQPVFCGVHGALSLVFCVVFCRSLLLGFFCRLYCLFFNDLRILITLLVSSNSSCPYRASELNPSLCRVYGAWSLVFCVVFCRSLLLVFFCRLYCLSFDLRILITTLVSTNSSYP